MNAQHYFCLGPACVEPARWREAFPAGQALDGAGLTALLATEPEADRVVWLSAADVEWPARLQQLLRARPSERVVLLSSTPDESEELRALNGGVRGYAHDHAVPELLQEVAVVVLHGGLWVGPHLMQRLVGATQAALTRRAGASEAVAGPAAEPGTGGWARLSVREAQVVRAVTAGHSNKEVAALLRITERTVKSHLGAAFEKLGVRDRLQLVLHLSMEETLEPLAPTRAKRPS